MPRHSYRLIPPGARKGNTYWLVRGSVAGREFEISTKQRDKAAAERAAPGLVAALVDGRAAAAAPVTTFAQASARYLAFRNPSKVELTRHERVAKLLGQLQLDAVTIDEISRAANEALPDRAPATQNREFFTPAATVLHYAAENQWCAYRRIRKRRESEPVNRSVTPELAELLIANATHDADLELLLTMVFFQGRRVGDALRIEGDGERCRIDLEQRLMGWRIGKTDRWKWSALHPRVFVLLANRAPLPQGRILRWNHYQSAHHHLKELCRKLGVKFTFHMARHSFATWLRRKKVDLKGVQNAGDWASFNSVLRYQHVDVDDQREILDLIGTK